MNNIPRRDKAFRFKAEVKDAEKGRLEAIVSCFGNKDSYGDIVCKGAFARFISDCKAQGGSFPPGVWSHDWDRPVAETLNMWEEDDGLHVLAQFNLDTQDGRDAYSNVKKKLFKEYSFAFCVADEMQTKDGNLLKDLYPVFEWSPTLVGANRATRTVDVKAGDINTSGRDVLTITGGTPVWISPPGPAAADTAEPRFFKAAYLGPYSERNAAMEALMSLNSDLMYNSALEACYDCDGDDDTTDQAVADWGAACDEFRDLTSGILRAILAMEKPPVLDDDNGAYASPSLYSLLLERFPEPTKSELPAGSLVTQAEAALAVVEAFRARIGALNTLRMKEGRVLSDANRGRVSGVRADLAACIEQLDTFLTDTQPQTATAADAEAKAAIPPALLAAHLAAKNAALRSLLSSGIK